MQLAIPRSPWNPASLTLSPPSGPCLLGGPCGIWDGYCIHKCSESGQFPRASKGTRVSACMGSKRQVSQRYLLCGGEDPGFRFTGTPGCKAQPSTYSGHSSGSTLLPAVYVTGGHSSWPLPTMQHTVLLSTSTLVASLGSVGPISSLEILPHPFSKLT